MKRLIVVATTLVLSLLHVRAQDTIKTNPIIYTESLFGYSPLGAKGVDFGLSLSYQFKKSLFTVRGNTIADNFGILSDNAYGEIALLYGLRFIRSGHSLSTSIGISKNEHDELYTVGMFGTDVKNDFYWAIPYELNIKWFNKEKEKVAILGLFPIGNVTAFGGGAGFKLHGNVSKNPYLALAFVGGFGFHKRY